MANSLMNDLVSQIVTGINPSRQFEEYQFRAIDYIQNFLKWNPWSGIHGDGQKEIIEYYNSVIQEQIDLNEAQEKAFAEGLPIPQKVIKNWIRIESGHTTGKTKLASGIASHFFDCFVPSMVYCFAPTFPQVNDLLFKEIRTDRRVNNMPGEVLEQPTVYPPDRTRSDWFIKGKATGHKTESVQGQHGKYTLYILDEAEGIPDFVFDAVKSMSSGGVSIVLLLANPRTRESAFFRIRSEESVKSFRLSCLNHPNVVLGYEIVPNAVKREYVNNMIKANCIEVENHNPEYFTFSVEWIKNKIFRPNAEFLYRVMGIAPMNDSDKTLVPSGLYERVQERTSEYFEENNKFVIDNYDTGYEGIKKKGKCKLNLGVDVARFGQDNGTVFAKLDNYDDENNLLFSLSWLVAEINGSNTTHYAIIIKNLIRKILNQETTDNDFRYVDDRIKIVSIALESLQIRVDGTGGYGGGVIDQLDEVDEIINQYITDMKLKFNQNVEEPEFVLCEVLFNNLPSDRDVYKNRITELYGHAGEWFKSKHSYLLCESNHLMVDLTERFYKYMRNNNKEVKVLEAKDNFKARFKRSPDLGDGFVLAVGHNSLFSAEVDLMFL